MIDHKIYLINWTVREVSSDGSSHFVGIDKVTRQVVVSPCIISFSKATKVGVTRNESKFILIGPPNSSSSSDATNEKAWEIWCQQHKVAESLNITEEYL